MHARREALVILGLWAAAMLWVVPHCYFFGYHPVENPEQLKTIIGIPDWVFWGVFVPWLACCLFLPVFSFWLIQDDDPRPSEELGELIPFEVLAIILKRRQSGSWGRPKSSGSEA
ncbi:MAG: DUF997 family protein [Planctomycetaceae bacterium]